MITFESISPYSKVVYKTGRMVARITTFSLSGSFVSRHRFTEKDLDRHRIRSCSETPFVAIDDQ